MDFKAVRETIIVALFSDDELYEELVLKGGNALTIVHRLGKRVSMDVDFSISGEFQDPKAIEARIKAALTQKFGERGFKVFDFKFSLRPEGQAPGERWGGYAVEFKIMETRRFDEMKDKESNLGMYAEVIGDGQQRKLIIEISKYEFVAKKERAEVDSYTIFVYSPNMIAIEKLRAICQQMESYRPRAYKTARARDFYDIHAIVTEGGVDIAQGENRELIRSIFAAKDVPLSLLDDIARYREFHQRDWEAVKATVGGEVKDFDFYFDFVLDQVRRLEAFWRV